MKLTGLPLNSDKLIFVEEIFDQTMSLKSASSSREVSKRIFIKSCKNLNYLKKLTFKCLLRPIRIILIFVGMDEDRQLKEKLSISKNMPQG